MAVCCGVDVGSMTAKAVLMQDGEILQSAVILVENGAAEAAEQVLDKALGKAGLFREVLKACISTGYGRERVAYANRTESEIACHGRGAWWQAPEVRSVIDIGGQDAKAIRLGDNGNVIRYQYNDKCASGTGRFLEMMADALEVNLWDMGALAGESTNRINISNQCVIFAETEVVSLLGAGKAVPDILNGIHHALASRVVAMARSIGVERELVFTGGVAKNSGVVKAIEEALNLPLQTLEHDPQINGALGAALFAQDIAAMDRAS